MCVLRCVRTDLIRAPVLSVTRAAPTGISLRTKYIYHLTKIAFDYIFLISLLLYLIKVVRKIKKKRHAHYNLFLFFKVDGTKLKYCFFSVVE